MQTDVSIKQKLLSTFYGKIRNEQYCDTNVEFRALIFFALRLFQQHFINKNTYLFHYFQGTHTTIYCSKTLTFHNTVCLFVIIAMLIDISILLYLVQWNYRMLLSKESFWMMTNGLMFYSKNNSVLLLSVKEAYFS